MKKVIIIGSPGAGKSTFARHLANKTGIPLFHLDMIWHKPDKTNISREEFDIALEDIMSGKSWIIDGNYNRTMQKRLQKCDTVFLLDYPTEICLEGAEARVGKKRADLPWIEDKLDDDFRIWIEEFSKIEIPKIYALLSEYTEKEIYIFKSRSDADRFLEK